MLWLGLVSGVLVGLSLGLTGGGGAIFAVPLLVYGLEVPAREAINISLAAVGATAAVGCWHRWRLGQVDFRTGLLFAVAGMAGAPIGSWLAGLVPDTLLLLLFAVLMVVVAIAMWRKASPPILESPSATRATEAKAPTCQRDASGALQLNTRCAAVLLLVGCGIGLLSGMFGVGGGLIAVPALVLFSQMPIQRAVGTSLFVISLISLSGVAAQAWQGRNVDPVLTALFVAGGIMGMFSGAKIGLRLSPSVLQRLFAVIILTVAAFVIVRNLAG